MESFFFLLFFIMNFKNSPELVKFVDNEYRKINALSAENYLKWLETASPEAINRYNDYTEWLKELNKPPTLKQKIYKVIRAAYTFLKNPLKLIATAALIILFLIVTLVGFIAICFIPVYFYTLIPFIGIIVGLFIFILSSMIM